MASEMATVTSKGQVTIPAAIRQTFDIRSQDLLLFVQEGDHLLLIPVRRRSLRDLYAALPATTPYPGIDALRRAVGQDLGRALEAAES